MRSILAHIEEDSEKDMQIECGYIFVAGLMRKDKFLFKILSNRSTFADVMTGVYTEETLQPLNKTQLIRLLLKNQE